MFPFQPPWAVDSGGRGRTFPLNVEVWFGFVASASLLSGVLRWRLAVFSMPQLLKPQSFLI